MWRWMTKSDMPSLLGRHSPFGGHLRRRYLRSHGRSKWGSSFRPRHTCTIYTLEYTLRGKTQLPAMPARYHHIFRKASFCEDQGHRWLSSLVVASYSVLVLCPRCFSGKYPTSLKLPHETVSSLPNSSPEHELVDNDQSVDDYQRY